MDPCSYCSLVYSFLFHFRYHHLCLYIYISHLHFINALSLSHTQRQLSLNSLMLQLLHAAITDPSVQDLLSSSPSGAHHPPKTPYIHTSVHSHYTQVITISPLFTSLKIRLLHSIPFIISSLKNQNPHFFFLKTGFKVLVYESEYQRSPSHPHDIIIEAHIYIGVSREEHILLLER